MFTLYQAEWCPYSSAVREILTELGVDFVAKQVAPYPEQRDELRAVSGDDSIPTLVTDDGDVVIGTRAIFRYLESFKPGSDAEPHRRRLSSTATRVSPMQWVSSSSGSDSTSPAIPSTPHPRMQTSCTSRNETATSSGSATA